MGVQHPDIRFEHDSPARGLVFTTEQMRCVDTFAIEQCRIPGILLMEHAAIALRDAALALSGADAPTTILCGPGNNGGDGYALARLLHIAQPSRTITLIPMGEPKPGTDAATNFIALLALAKDSLGSIRVLEDLPTPIEPSGLIVDAMFGSGLTKPLSGRCAEAVDWIASARAGGSRVLAVDVPSGLDADLGLPIEAHGEPSLAVRADHTVTLGGLKRGLLASKSREWTGVISVGDIGVPRWVLERFGEKITDADQG